MYRGEAHTEVESVQEPLVEQDNGRTEANPCAAQRISKTKSIVSSLIFVLGIFPLSMGYSQYIEDGVQTSTCGRGLVNLGVDGGQDRRAVGASDVARHSNLFFSRHDGGAGAIRRQSCGRVEVEEGEGGGCSHRGFVSGFRGDAQRERVDGLTGVLFLAGQGTKYVASKKADKGGLRA